MGKIVAGLRITLDGIAGDADHWFAPYAEGQVQHALGANMATMGTMVLGRRTYEIFAATWPGKHNPIADVMNNVPKLVVSSTLENADWQNSTVVNTDIAATLTELKRGSQKDIRVVGSLSVVRHLIAEDVLDELELFIHPLILGHGQRLFTDVDQLRLRLASSETFDNGVIHAVYQPEDKP